MKTFCIIVLIIVVLGVIYSFANSISEGLSVKDSAGNAWGCFLLAFFAIFVLVMSVGTLKSCADDISSPGRDYYDDRAR